MNTYFFHYYFSSTPKKMISLRIHLNFNLNMNLKKNVYLPEHINDSSFVQLHVQI